MQIVINISENTYKRIQALARDGYFDHDMCGNSMRRIANGTPLPKGHGRIGDLDKLEKEIDGGIKAGLMIEGYENYSNINDVDDCLEYVKYAPTIIEADKEYEDEIITRGNCMMCGKELDEGLFFCKECEAKAESEDKK